MPNIQVSRACRTAIIFRMANVSNGFTPRLLAALSDAAIALPTGWRLPILFDNSGRNFFNADIDPGDLDSTSSITYPAMALYALRAVNQNKEKFRAFSGEVEFGLNFFATWINSRALPDFETVMDCVEEALIGTFNAELTIDWSVGNSLVYNGDISIARSRLSKDSANWFQTLASRLTLEVHAAG